MSVLNGNAIIIGGGMPSAQRPPLTLAPPGSPLRRDSCHPLSARPPCLAVSLPGCQRRKPASAMANAVNIRCAGECDAPAVGRNA